MADSTGCCIVGGGPAGAVLALLLARRGVPVALLEARDDFDRAFRGDTVHPSVLPAIQSIKILNWNAGPNDGKTEAVVEIRLVDQARYQEMLMWEAGQLIDCLKVDGTLKHEHTVAQGFVDALRQGLEARCGVAGPNRGTVARAATKRSRPTSCRRSRRCRDQRHAEARQRRGG